LPDRVVSSEDELLILVNEKDEEVGHLAKAACHDGDGVLHRAFSIFVFNDDGDLLVQRRSREKRLWPGYWSNSCCSHPRRGEVLAEAVHRRLHEELGMTSDLAFLYKFGYFARFGDLGSERELCSVFIGRSTDPVRANANEVDEWRWISAGDLDVALRDRSDEHTPWLQLEWPEVRAVFSERLGFDVS
jgi:isopentenyl-diphosphate delta-isomerase